MACFIACPAGARFRGRGSNIRPARSWAARGRSPKCSLGLAAVAVLLFAPPGVRAATYSSWAVSSGDWSVAQNWGGTLPTSSYGAYVINGGTAAITLPGAACNYLYLGDPNSTNAGTVQMSAGSLSTILSEYLGNTGTGTFTQSGGTNNVNGTLYLGMNSGSTGYYNLSGSGWLTGWWEYVGYSGVGAFSQSGGTNQAPGGLYLGYLVAGSSGSYDLDGSGLVSASTEYVGCTGIGSFTQSAGTNSVVSLVLGSRAEGNGTYNLSGGMLTLKSLSGGSGTAAFNFSGGTLQAGGSFSTVEAIALGNGNATIDTNGYTVTLSGLVSGSGNLAKVGGGQLTLSGPSTYIGGIVISGGTLQLGGGTAPNSYLWSNVTDNGTLALDPPSQTYWGAISGSGNVVKLGTAALTLAEGDTYSGSTLVSGGTLILGSPAALQQSTLDTSDAGAVSFGSLTAATLGGLTGSGALDLGSAAVSVGNNNSSTTFSGALSGLGSLTKIGSGKLTLAGSNTYTGGTSINSGTLAITSSGSIASAAVSVASGGVLNVSGSLSGNPALTVNGAATFSNTSPTLASLSGGSSGSIVLNSVLLVVSSGSYSGAISGDGGVVMLGPGTLTLTGSNTYTGGTLVVDGALVENSAAIPAGSLLSVSAGGSVVLGTPGAAEPLGLLGGGSAGPLASQASGSRGGVNAVPEPSALALLGAGALGLLARAWRRRKRRP